MEVWGQKEIKSILEECVTERTCFNNLYKNEQWYPISDKIFDAMKDFKIKLSSRRGDPYEKIDDLLSKFKKSYESNKDFDKSSSQFLQAFKWPDPPASEGVILTRLPSQTEYSYDDDISTIEGLNKTPAHFPDLERDCLDSETYLALMSRYSRFKRDGSPLSVLEAFLAAYQGGIYPPVWVLDYMANIFKTFHDSWGTRSLDELFGFNKKGRGGAFQKAIEEGRDEILCRNVARLEQLFGFDRKTACKLEVERLHATKDFNKTPLLTLKTKLSWRTLEARYRKKWASLYKYDKKKELWKKWVKDHGEEFLSHYPSLKR